MKQILGMMALVFMMSLLPSAVSAQEETQLMLFEDIQPYQGNFGANSSFYGLKLFLERVDVAFEFNTMKKIEKQMNHARTRLAEAKAELLQNRVAGAEKAMAHYTVKISEVEQRLEKVRANETTALMNTQLEQVQLRLVRQNHAMQNLIEEAPEAERLQTALQTAVQNTERVKTHLRAQLKK